MVSFQDKSSKLKFSFKSSRETHDIPKSPSSSFGLLRVASPPLRTNASPACRNLTPRKSENNLADEILFQCRRLDPTFCPPNSGIGSWVLQSLKCAVDFVIEEKKKLKEYRVEDIQEKIDFLEKKVKEAEEKANENIEFKKKLCFREKRIEIEESKLISEKRTIQNEKNQMSTIKKHYLELENEVKLLKEELKEEKERAQELEKRIYELFNDNMEKDSELEQLKSFEKISKNKSST